MDGRITLACHAVEVAKSRDQRMPNRRTGIFWTCWLTTAALSSVAVAAPRTDAGLELFEKEIRPLLVQQCQKCHGSEKAQGGLRLDSREAILKGGSRGPTA